MTIGSPVAGQDAHENLETEVNYAQGRIHVHVWYMLQPPEGCTAEFPASCSCLRAVPAGCKLRLGHLYSPVLVVNGRTSSRR